MTFKMYKDNRGYKVYTETVTKYWKYDQFAQPILLAGNGTPEDYDFTTQEIVHKLWSN